VTGPGSRRGTLLTAALAPIVWGSTYVVTTELLPPGRPLLVAALRALPAGLLLLAWSRTLPRGEWWWRVLVLGTLNIGAFFALLFVAAYRLPGGVAATAGAIQPVVVAALAAVLLGETFRRRTAVAGAAGVGGVALLVLGPDAALDPIGVLAALAGTLSMAVGVVLTKRWGRPVGLLTMTGWQLTAGGTLLLPLALLVEGAPPAYSAVNLAATAWLTLVGTGVAYALWFRGIERLPVSSLTFLGLLSPVVATLLGWVVLGQTLTPAQLLGAVLVVFAVVHPQRAGGATDPSRDAVRPSRVGKGAARRRNPTTALGRDAVGLMRVGKRAARRRNPTRVPGRDGGRPVPG
jgi:probable blue pigment (indigoidine) exporter